MEGVLAEGSGGADGVPRGRRHQTPGTRVGLHQAAPQADCPVGKPIGTGTVPGPTAYHPAAYHPATRPRAAATASRAPGGRPIENFVARS